MLKAVFGTIGDYIRRSDILFWLLTAAAAVYGCLLIASQQRDGGTDFLQTQVIAVLIGHAAAVLVSLVDYRYWGKRWWLIAGMSLLLTGAVFVVGIQINGTDDVGWIRLPGGLTFQPSELTKIGFILTFSQHIAYLTEKKRLKKLVGVLTLLLHAMIPIGLIHLQGDDGAALVFALLFLVMSFAAGVPLRYFIVLPVTLLLAVPFVWMRMLNDDQKNRLLVLFTADDSMLKTFGWQQYQGKLSIASGGLTGKGYCNGPRVADNVVPYQENDFIFTVAGEELGFIGCAVIILLFGLLLFQILHIAVQAADPLGRSIGFGFFALVGSQALINLGMVLGYLPVIGITLPFFSAGGTSIICLYIGVGLVQSVKLHPADPTDHPLTPPSAKVIRLPGKNAIKAGRYTRSSVSVQEKTAHSG